MQLPNIPFELILFLLFIVLPGISSLLRRRNQDAGQSKQAQSEPTRETSSTAQTSTSTSSTSPSRPTPSGSPGDGVEDWLEQARKRVAEARQQEGSRPLPVPQRPAPPLVRPAQTPQGTSQRQRPAVPSQATRERSLEGRSRESRQPENRSLEGSSLEGSSSETYRRERSSLETLQPGRTDLGEAPPLLVQRLGSTKRATITERELRFDAHDIAKGLIWHQVLSPPRSTLRRTRLSRRRP